MIIDRVEAKDMLNAMEVPTLNLTDLGIGEERLEVYGDGQCENRLQEIEQP